MANAQIATYLSDHMAGSTMLLDLLEHVEAACAGSTAATFAAELRGDVLLDRRQLEALMVRLDISASVPRRAAAWISEKLARLKLKLDDPAAGDFRLLESWEAASLGVEGKRLLWVSLAHLAERHVDLRSLDYAPLIRRAEDQRSRIEARRLDAAAGSLVG